MAVKRKTSKKVETEFDVEVIESDFTVHGKTYMFPCEVYIRYDRGSIVTPENYLKQVMDQLAKFYGWEKDEAYLPSMRFKAYLTIDYIGGYKNPGIFKYIPMDISFNFVENIIESIAKHYNWKISEK